MEQVRIDSLRGAGVEGEGSGRRSHRSHQSRSRESSSSRRPDRASSRTRENEPGLPRERRTGDHLTVGRRQGRSRSSGHRSDDSSDSRRQVGHQNSLRSLLEADMSERDMDREIEELAMQIQAEGLLDGRDLDNIDLTRDDDLSRKIAEVYRRRQRERSRHEAARRSNASAVSTTSRSDVVTPNSGQRDQREGRPRTLRRNSTGAHSPAAATSVRSSEDRSRPPLAPSAASHLEVQRKRRPQSTGRSRASTTPIEPTGSEAARAGTRSQTDLSVQTGDGATARPVLHDGRSTSSPTVSSAHNSPGMPSLPFASRVPQSPLSTPPQSSTSRFPENRRSLPPTDLAAVSNIMASFSSTPPTAHHRRTPSQFYSEPSITCSSCDKQHIEYDLHYNCKTCAAGSWNICLNCYRQGKGCQHWFGFGYVAWNKWEEARRRNPGIEQPHMLTANRYQPPRAFPGGADGRRTMTMEDPALRLESGTFCANCLSLANGCYWRCDVCNRGDWGYCNTCVNQGKCCTHPLLPLTYMPSSGRATPPRSPQSSMPYAAAILPTSGGSGIGPFMPISFKTRCDACQNTIDPTEHRHHCFECTSSLEPDTLPGDYDICTACYEKLATRRQVSAENGLQGWRRCPSGHRMVIVTFQEGRRGQWRHIIQDLVGGRSLARTALDGGELMKWTWQEGGDKRTRIVTKDVAGTAPTSAPGVPDEELTQTFPSEGSLGMKCTARWGWFGQNGQKADDELNFPVGAEIREVMDVNTEWYFGTYLGDEGLFPAGYVVVS